STVVVIGTIQPGSAAEKAGLQAGDVVRQIDEVKVGDWGDFTNYIKRKKVGEKVTIKVTRGDQDLDIEATLGERPNQ
ncbi:MAG: PDZ domain-containing protein, partial [Planctomycetia bacterium]|nr:PDZ domain-containing protein [Planctomycetia bacterium]